MTTIKPGFLLCPIIALCSFLLPERSGAQSPAPGYMQEQLEKFNDLFIQEKIYLHTNKNFYVAGEIIWFKIYYVNGSTHRPLSLSKVAYVEILDRSGKPVLQAKLVIADTGGHGSMYLPLTLNSGHYVLRAYTNWMKNFDPAFFFEKKITIANTIKPVGTTATVDTIRTRVDFFPEGGYLVQGIETKIGFRIADNFGRGVEAHGLVTDNAGDTLVTFSPHHLGIGNFSFSPVPGRNYTATITLPGGQTLLQPLPEVKQYGYSMSVTDNKDGRFRVKVMAKKNSQATEELTLLVHTRQSIKIAEHGFLADDRELIFFIDKSRLSEGVSHLTLFNKEQRPVCERLVFIKPRQTNTIKISPGRNSYTARQGVDLSVWTEADADSARCSVSIFQIDSLPDIRQGNMASYLLLTSDLGQEIESPGYYLQHDTANEEAADNLMLTYGWRRFRWENLVSAESSPAIRFIPEYRGQIVSARVINTGTGNLVAGADCFLSVPSSPFGFYMASSDKSGLVRFDIRDYYGPGEIIAQVGEIDRKQYRIDLLSPFAGEPASMRMPRFSMDKTKENILLQKSIAMQSQNIYMPDSIRKFNAPNPADSLPFFGKAEFSYLLDDYKRFTTMEEVLREYVTRVNVVLRNKKLYMSIFDEEALQVYHDGILVLLDGVPLNDYNAIFSYDPLKVRKLDVIPKRYVFGSRVFSGIMSLETFEGKFNGFELDPDLIAVDYEGLQLQREFYSPVYENNNQQNREPDLRTTLHWEPELLIEKKEKKNIRFYTSDQRGKFMAVLEGINKKGEIFFSETSFIVE